MGKLRIAITGATGLLGRNLLFEFIKQNLSKLDSLEIFVLGRSSPEKQLPARITEILSEDGLNYLGIPKTQKDRIQEFCKTNIRCVEIDLTEMRLDISEDNLKQMKEAPIDFFFHVAALTDFRSTSQIIKELYATNVFGTKQILQLVAALRVKEFCYVGSAYSCGNVSGKIQPDCVNWDKGFRNPYEKTKLDAEVLVREFAKKNKIRCRYFRPSTICGRLIEPPVGAINKFDVFYSWAAWFLRMKIKILKTYNDKFVDPVEMKMRICYNKNGGLNIVPADFGAKLMFMACTQEDKKESYHIVNDEETSHLLYIPLMLQCLNVFGTRAVDSIPADQNKLEALYYRTAGGLFTPYITADPMLFETANIPGILCGVIGQCPPVDKKNFSFLMRYAQEHEFGMRQEVQE